MNLLRRIDLVIAFLGAALLTWAAVETLAERAALGEFPKLPAIEARP